MAGRWLLVLFLIHGYTVSVLHGTCSLPEADSPSCVCVISGDGGTIDLTAIANKDGTPRFKDITDRDGYRYFYNPCYDFTMQGDCRNTAGCQYSDSYRSIGTTSSELFTNENGKFFLQYFSGTDGRSSIVNLICEPDFNDPVLEAIGESYPGSLTYEFNLRSRCACPDTCAADENIAGAVGITIIILSLAGLATYFIAGGIVLKDGCIFTFRPLTGLVRTSESSATLLGLKE